MDVFNALAAIPAIGPFLPYLLLAGVICAALSTALPPPSGSGSFMGQLYATLYGLVNWLGLNFGHAKNAGSPGFTKPPAGTVSVLIALIIVGALSGCAGSSGQTAETIATNAAPIAGQIAVATASAPQLADMQKMCADEDVAKAASLLLPASAQTVANQVAAPLDGFCGPVKQGKTPSNADGNTINWGGIIVASLNTINALAK
jgi:hypothetical protein